MARRLLLFTLLVVLSSLICGIAAAGVHIRDARYGTSGVQTAEGAMNEVHTIPGGTRERPVQVANDTLTNTDNWYGPDIY